MTSPMQSVLDNLDKANARLRGALRENRMDALPELMAEVQELEQQRTTLMREMTRSMTTDAPFAPGPSLRVKVVSTLRLVQRPLAAKFIAQIARARFGYEIDPRSLASMRRDELRSFRAYMDNPDGAQSKAQLVVPGLSFDRYTSVRGVLALSDWDLSRRLIAPSSPRVNVLLATQALANLIIDSPAAPWTPAVESLVVTVGRTLMPFVERATAPTAQMVRSAAAAELDVIAPADRAEREQATTRARMQLSDEQQLFGVVPLGAVGRRAS